MEYTLPPMPPMSGLMASSLVSPLDEKEDTEPAVDDETKPLVAAITTAGVWPAATAATIAAPASRAIKAVGKKGYPLMSIM